MKTTSPLRVDLLGKWPQDKMHTAQQTMKNLVKTGPHPDYFVENAILSIIGEDLIFLDDTKEEIVKFKVSMVKDPVAFVKKEGSGKKTGLSKVVIFLVEKDEFNKEKNMFVAIQCLSKDPQAVVEDIANAKEDAQDAQNYEEIAPQQTSRKASQVSNSPTMLYASVRRNPSNSASLSNDLEGGHPPESGHPPEGGHAQSEETPPPVEKRDIARVESIAMTHPRVIYETSEDQIEKARILLNYCTGDITLFCGQIQDSKENVPGARSISSFRASEFTSTFQKIKLAFNLLAKLNFYLRDSNSTDALHYVFRNLQFLIHEGRRIFGVSLQCDVDSPLLSQSAIQFLGYALVMKERQTWESCGYSWKTPRNEFRGEYIPYRPVFSDNWSPGVIDEEIIEKPQSPIYAAPSDLQRTVSPVQVKASSLLGNDTDSDHYTDALEQEFEMEANEEFRDRLLENNANVVLVIYPWAPRTRKELDVKKGEYLETLETHKKWWKCRNMDDKVGYLPSSILTTLVKAENLWQQDQIEKARRLVDRSKSFSPERPMSPARPLPPPVKPKPQPPPRRESPTPSLPPPAPPKPELDEFDGHVEPELKMAPKKKFKPRAMNGMDSLRSNHSMQEELQMILTLKNEKDKHLDIHRTPDVYIDSKSSVGEVRKWLQAKDFSMDLRNTLEGYDGKQILTLRRKDLEGLFGHEGSRLDSQITLSRNKSHYTQGKSSELREILAKAKQRAENYKEATETMEKYFRENGDEANA